MKKWWGVRALLLHCLAPARGGRLIAVGRVQKMGRLLGFSDVEVKDEEGKAVARKKDFLRAYQLG